MPAAGPCHACFSGPRLASSVNGLDPKADAEMKSNVQELCGESPGQEYLLGEGEREVTKQNWAEEEDPEHGWESSAAAGEL